MECPACDANNDAVVGKYRPAKGNTVRRYRKCLSCGWKFTTVERWNGRTNNINPKRKENGNGRDRQEDGKESG